MTMVIPYDSSGAETHYRASIIKDNVNTENEIATDPFLQERFNDLAIATLQLDSDDPDKRNNAQYRIGLAIAFIIATPYVFAQEGI